MVDAPETWEFPKPGTEDELAARMAAEPRESRPGSSEQGPTISEPTATSHQFPAPQSGAYLHTHHYHVIANEPPLATAAAQGLISPAIYGPLPWGHPWPGPYLGSSKGYGPPPPGLGSIDEEAAAAAAEVARLFSQGPVLRAFVQKVLAIVCMQLLFTALVAVLFYVYTPLRLAVIHHPWVWTLCWAVTFVCLVALGYNENARRSYPTNCITLCIFMVSFALLVGIGTSFFHTHLLIEALGLTAVTVACIFIIASSTSVDFTMAGGFLWTCGFVLVLCILFGSFIEDNVFWLIISGAGAILFSAYLLYDLQKLMGGRYLAVHPDDYIYAAVQVYLDVVTLFVLTLGFLNLAGGN
ncbi:hypothetical protein CVIRNUC_008590 [Coccomyxa viridis]|uniref:Uncharacterized protein n=1 Tax=Coccomyxa viridis TaxID=1274662 RepID=A0AAV1IGP9_9CHLO|nr:hypothetical protein CVIRNUC_008590 [Coccomyxa viridis]